MASVVNLLWVAFVYSILPSTRVSTAKEAFHAHARCCYSVYHVFRVYAQGFNKISLVVVCKKVANCAEFIQALAKRCECSVPCHDGAVDTFTIDPCQCAIEECGQRTHMHGACLLHGGCELRMFASIPTDCRVTTTCKEISQSWHLPKAFTIRLS